MFLRIKSKRAFSQVKMILGVVNTYYYLDLSKNGYFIEVTDDEYEKVKLVKGISKARVNSEELGKCW